MTQRITPEDIVHAGHVVAFSREGDPAVVKVTCVAAHTLPQARAYTQHELEEAFKMVQNTEHWKGPIDAEIEEGAMQRVDAAIAHFCYGFAAFTPLGNGRVRVTAPGYYGAERLLEQGGA